MIRSLMKKRLTKRTTIRKINLFRSSLIIWNNKNNKIIKINKKTNKKILNLISLKHWLLLKMDVKLSLKFLSILKSSLWLKLFKKYWKILSWNKLMESNLQSFYKEKVEFHTFKPKELTSIFYKNSAWLINNLSVQTISKQWLKNSEFKQQEMC